MDQNLIKNQSNNIKPINTNSVHKICSGQVVLSLAVAVKELLENALDAGATNIDIRLKNYGTEIIEVSDNGSGVTEDNFAALTMKYHTSKISEYSDLLGVSSFGFRGEALSSLCSLANLVVTTRHQKSNYATKLQYDQKGNIISKTPCSRQVGTTVTLSNLFFSLPVRQKEFHKNSKREFNKMTNLLYAYCLISRGVRITCSNQINSNSKSVVVATTGSKSYKDNIASVFGLKQLQSIVEIRTELVTSIKENIFKGLSGEVKENNETIDIDDVEIDLSEDSNDSEQKGQDFQNESFTLSQKSQGYKNCPNPVELEGYISSCEHGSGRSSTDRQFYYVNSRPCEPAKVMKIVNETYKQYNPNQYPFIFLNINMDRLSVDVNVTPDKRKVFLTKEKNILDVIKASLTKLFENVPRTLKVNSSMTDIKDDVSIKNLYQPRIFNSFMQQFSVKEEKNAKVGGNNTVDLKRKSTTNLDCFISKSKRIDTSVKEEINILTEQENNLDEHDVIDKNDENQPTKSDVVIFNDTLDSEKTNTILKNMNDSDINNKSHKCECVSPPHKNLGPEIMYLEDSDKLPETQIRSISDIVCKSSTIYCKTKKNNQKIIKDKITQKEHSNKISPSKFEKTVTDQKDFGKFNVRKTISFKTTLEEVKVQAEIYNNGKGKCLPDRIKFRSAIDPVFNKKCEEELNREISKDSFKQMVIIGQFNLGFIITRLEDDLFIIDQHATDEIYNFETLQRTTELTNQKLVIPQQLELTGVNEQILMDNLDVFKKNGFTFQIDENAPPTKRVKLLTIPMSKNWIFGKDDIEELLFMLKESSTSEYYRPSRVRAMFASRACRKSVMIGMALSKSDMRQLVDHMAEIDKPWNCPHGRPTIRHLVNLAMVHTSD
ncbi:mismatch repair endonuclease PMS2 [Zerene cesonia]|uniref:mismatch repair endonuclease PMS2 n=1 Tax=Zerene cesonia TaxID=33412 RepID=UPI0018E5A479|nr:mismatch repair endonuclease PMS2 [Zerene cesonia]